MAEKKWRRDDNLFRFVKREKIKGTLQQAAYEREQTRKMKDRTKDGKK